MPASKAEQVLETLRGVLDLVPGAVVQRNSVLPEKIPPGGLIVVRDGDPGEPEQALGGFGSTYYQHAVEIGIYLEEGDAAARHAAFDALLQQNRGSPRSRPDPRRPRLRPDLRPARTRGRGDLRRTGDQERYAFLEGRLRGRNTPRLMC